MSCIITMKGGVDSNQVDEDFVTMTNTLNVASASGKTFAILEDMDGGHIMVNMDQILFAKELED